MKQQKLIASMAAVTVIALMAPSAYAQSTDTYAPVGTVNPIRGSVGDGSGKICQEIQVDDKDSSRETLRITLIDAPASVKLEDKHLCAATTAPIPLSIARLSVTDPDGFASFFETVVSIDAAEESAKEEADQDSVTDQDMKPGAHDSEALDTDRSMDIMGSAEGNRPKGYVITPRPLGFSTDTDTMRGGGPADTRENTGPKEKDNTSKMSGNSNKTTKDAAGADSTNKARQEDKSSSAESEGNNSAMSMATNHESTTHSQKDVNTSSSGNNHEKTIQAPSPVLAKTGFTGQLLSITAGLLVLSTTMLSIRRRNRA